MNFDFCGANQWTGFYMITASKGLKTKCADVISQSCVIQYPDENPAQETKGFSSNDAYF